MPLKKTFCARGQKESCRLLETLLKIDVKKDLCVSSGETEDPGKTAGKTDRDVLENHARTPNARELSTNFFEHAHRETHDRIEVTQW